MEFPAKGLQEKVIHADKGEPSDMAGIELQFAPGALLVGFAHEFCAIHMVVGGQIEFHVEHDALPVQGLYGLHEAIDIRRFQGVSEHPDTAVAVRFRENFDGVTPDLLVGVPFPAQGVVNKEAVVLHAGDTAMGEVLASAVQASEAFTGEIIAGPHDQVAGGDQFFRFCDLEEGPFHFPGFGDGVLWCDDQVVMIRS